MKILVICQYYFPEPFRVADICEELVRRGNAVTVVTGVPNYPMGEIYPGYEHGERAREIINGVRVIRCPIRPRKKGAINRFLNYYSYPFHSKRALKRLKNDFDVVFVYQLSPVMMANAGIWYAKKHHIKSTLYCLDLWPASLNAGGISNGLIYSWFRRESEKVYGNVDQILISSQSFASYFHEEFGRDDTLLLQQYAETAYSPNECKKKADECIDFMFTGNVGVMQSVDTIIKAAALCKDIRNIRWHIVGDGIDLESCKTLAEKLEVPVIFHGRQPLEQMPHYYSMADAMLITLKNDPVISMTLPGKMQSYMAAGKPIIGAINGEAKKVIEQFKCGYCVPACDYEELAVACRKFAEERSEHNVMGKNARAAYEQEYSKDKFIDSLEKDLMSMCAQNKTHTPDVEKVPQ